MSRIPYLDELQAELERAAQRSLIPVQRRWAGMAVAAAAFVLVVAVGAVMWLVRGPQEAVAPSTTTTTAPQIDAVDPPLAWARLPQDAVYVSETSFTLQRVVRGPRGFVAIGDEAGASEQRNGLVLLSEDGNIWTRIDDPAVLQGVSLQAVADSGSSMALAALGPVTDLRFYTSADGATWDAASIDATGDIAGRIAHAIAPLGGGFIAAGSGWLGDGPDAVETGVIWVTSSGHDWQEIVVPEFASSSLNDLLVVGDAIHIAGLSEIGDGESTPTVWSSRDDGATWSSTRLPRIEEHGFAGVSGIAERDGLWVAAGFEGNSGAVWTSDNGLDWRRYIPQGDEFSAEKLPTRVHDVVATERGIVAVGADNLGSDIRRITWVSPNGDDWTRLDLADPTTIEGASLLAYSLAAHESTVVAVGVEMAIEGAGLGAVFISPPGPGMARLAAIEDRERPDADDSDDQPAVVANDGWLRLGLDSLVAEGYGTHDGGWVDATLNPLLMWDAGDIARLVVPGAFRLDATTGELTPWIVERIPRLGDGLEVADDGTVTVTYTVREEAVWEDGTPVTGADLAFTHELIMRYADQIEVDTSVHGLIDTGSMVAEGRSLTFQLTTPDVAYERLFEWVLPSHMINPDTFLDDWNEQLWLSAGPFRFVSFDIPTARLTEPSIIVLERNPNYWETDPATGDTLPYLAGIELYVFPGGTEPGTGSRLIKARELDAVIGRMASTWELPSYGDLDEQGLEIRTTADTLYEVMIFNLAEGRFEANPASLNDILEYRQAVLSAIDRRALAETLPAIPVNSIVGLAYDRYDHDAWTLYEDPARVGELLTEVGEPVGAVYTSSYADSTIAIGEAVASQLTSAGINTTTQFDGDFFGTQLPERQLDLFAIRLFASNLGPGSVVDGLEAFAPGQGIVDWTGLDAEADRYVEILEQARTEFEPDRLAELLQEAESVLADNALIYPLVLRQSRNVIYWPDRVQGITPNRAGNWNTWNAAWWRPGG
jgi:ABC-type transport system substrate-binding protein